MSRLKPYPFWLSHVTSTPKQEKLPKQFRSKGLLQLRELKFIKRDKKTGKFEKRTITLS